MHKLVLVRHGESEWNKENRFTGWQDVDLSEQGRVEARVAGETLLTSGIKFDEAHCSVLKRALRTLWIIQDEMDLLWLPVKKSWRLNERHYGALTGLNKSETAARHGEEQVKIWRRSYDTPPPMLEENDPRHPRNDRRYSLISPTQLPRSESLKDTVSRVLPYWESELSPTITKGKTLLVVAHGNSLRALVKHLDKLSAEDIMGVNIPTGIPLLYELDAKMAVTGKKYLGDPAVVEAAIAKVASQGHAKK